AGRGTLLLRLLLVEVGVEVVERVAALGAAALAAAPTAAGRDDLEGARDDLRHALDVAVLVRVEAVALLVVLGGLALGLAGLRLLLVLAAAVATAPTTAAATLAAAALLV